MTLQLLHSEFPYIWGKLYFLFYQCIHGRKRIWKACFVQVGDGVASQKLLCTTAQDGRSSLEFTEDIREYWINYRGPGSLAVVWFGSSPTPFSPSFPPVSSTLQRLTGRLRKRDNLLTSEGRREGEGAKSYDVEKAWSSINPSILSGGTISIKNCRQTH